MATLEMTHTKLAENGRIVIPAALRQALGFQAGDELLLSVEENGLRITTVKSRAEWAQRMVRQFSRVEGSVVDSLIADRREEARRQEAAE